MNNRPQPSPAPLLGAMAQRAGVDLMTPEEAANYLKCKPQTLANWRTTKRVNLPFVRVGKLIRYRKSDLDAFIQAGSVGSLDHE